MFLMQSPAPIAHVVSLGQPASGWRTVLLVHVGLQKVFARRKFLSAHFSPPLGALAFLSLNSSHAQRAPGRQTEVLSLFLADQ